MSLSSFFGRLIAGATGSAEAKAPRSAEAKALVDAIVEHPYQPTWKPDVATAPATNQVLAADPSLQMEVLLETLRRIGQERFAGLQYHRMFNLAALARFMGRRRLPWDEERLVALVEATRASIARNTYSTPVADVLGAVERWAAEQSVTPRVRAALQDLRERLGVHASNRATRKLIDRVDALTGNAVQIALAPGERWTEAAIDELAAMPDAAGWRALLAHAGSSDSAKPSRKWLDEARRLLEPIGEEEFKRTVSAWFARVGPVEGRSPLLPERNAAILRGLVWCCSLLEDAALSAAVGDLALVCFRKMPNWGPISARVGNACIYALGAMPGTEAIAQLGRVQAKVKYAGARRLSDRALDGAADRAGMTREDLEDLAVPDYGLDPTGERVEALGACSARIRIGGTTDVVLEWFKDGKPCKSVPVEAKRDHADAVKQLKRAAKDVAAMLSAQRDRLERLFQAERSWPMPAFRERLLDHPLLRSLARRLIWTVRKEERSATAMWLDGDLAGPDGSRLDWLDDETTVTLWHPLGSEVDEVRAWRSFLVERGIVQPFKQAHREIYLITEAELVTATYSNRFAAHVLRQHQLAALCRERGWTYRLQGNFDSANAPTLSLPRHGLRVDFFVEGIPNEQTTGAGIYLHVSTDQVRFSDGAGPRELAQVPPLVFSEVMRDVDLFVGVCSIGNDPTWVDQGAAPHRGYWESYAFGELSGSAESRRSLLEELLPKLRIAPACRIDGKFLVVRGELRTYKIHLGSGNILMEPNDQYLCIVPDRGGSEKVRLPFEGDGTLSIILSKAFLLAKDEEIKDETILRQIRR